VLHRVKFTEERIETVATNLLSDATEFSRDGAGVCDAVSALVTSPVGKDIPNDVHISILVQRRLLERVSKSPDVAIPALGAIRNHLLSCLSSSGSCLVQFCVAPSFPDPLPHFARAFSVSLAKTATSTRFFALPYTRQPTQCNGRCVLVPISGVESSFLQQWVQCDVPKVHPDFFPLLVLCELLSRTEGPLYTRIRGAGLAYDATVTFCFFSGLLCFNLHESSAPEKALAEFNAVLHDLESDDPTTVAAICSPFLIETARSSLLYYFHSDRATVPLVSSSALKGIFKGFATPQEEQAYQLNLDRVTQSDVLRVFRKYFFNFLKPEARATVVTAGPTTINHLAGKLHGEVVKLSVLSASIDIDACGQLSHPVGKVAHKAVPHKKRKASK